MLSLAGLCVALCAVPLAFWLQGGQWFDIASPSMGEAAPVGSLVLTRPVTTVSELKPGDVVTYRDAGTGRAVTHRVVGVHPGSAAPGSLGAGSVTTRGDINGATDPRPVGVQQILGREIAIIGGGGWAVRGLPLFALVSAAVVLGTRRLHEPLLRRAGLILGESLALALVLVTVRPLVGIQEILRMPQADGLTMTFVSTGLLPVRVSAESGEFADLVSGQVGAVHSSVRHPDGAFVFTSGAHLDWIGGAAVGVVVLAPLALILLLTARDARSAALRTGAHTEGAVPAVVGAVVVLGLVPALALGLLDPQASGAVFSARLADSANAAGSRTFFTCRAAVPGTLSPFVGYAIGTSGSSENDLSGHAFTGAYSTWVTGLIMLSTSVTPTSNHGCLRDSPAASVPFGGLLPLCLDTPDASVQSNPSVFSIEAWFATTTASNGKIIGFSSSHGIGGTQADRHIYLDPSGRLVFGVNPGTPQIAASPSGTSYADGKWHHVVATLSAAGMMLYADGVLVGANAAVTSAQTTTGYWEVGCGPTANLLTADGLTSFLLPNFFTGSLQYAAVYATALSATQVKEHYLAGAS